MHFGVAIFLTDDTPPPGEVGLLAEQREFASIWVPEHTHMPVDHSPFPRGGDLPRRYKRSLDPFVTLAAIAEATTTLRLGFGIVLITQRDPITTAKEVASLDWISGGRVDFGVGAGWNVPELENHGAPFGRRFKVMKERVEAMRAIWTQEEASYHGEFVDFDPLWSYPKPVQDPLPVYVGGLGERVIDRVLRYGDGWLPNVEYQLQRIGELRSRAEELGRPRPPVTFFGTDTDPQQLERLDAAGVDQALFMLPSNTRDKIEARLDLAAATVAEFRGS